MNRLLFPKIAVLLIFAVLVGRLYQLQLVDSEASRFRYATQVRTTRYLPVRPMRGEILASDGKTLLAESVPIFTVSIRPSDLPEAGTRERDQVFAHLGQLLGISSTLTLSPSNLLDQDPVLRGALIDRLGSEVLANVQQHELRLPQRIQVEAANSQVAVDLAERYEPLVGFLPQNPPSDTVQAGVTLAELSGPAAITGTLVISPVQSFEQGQALLADLRQALGSAAVDNAPTYNVGTWAAITVPPAHSITALELRDAYSMTLKLRNPIAEQVDRGNIPGYQTLVIKQDIPREVALVLRENAPNLPGVVVDLDYRRRYPLSGEVQSLSHVLGYIGRVNECELVRNNPARSWVVGLLDSIGHAVQCGVIKKQVNPYQLGMPSYLEDDRIGKDGLEASYEEELRGQLGIEAVLVDALGRPVRVPKVVQPARDGHNLVLTIDVQFQRQVEQILRNWIDIGEQRRQNQPERYAYRRNYKPIRSGVAIVMEVHTGRILAMASWPSYDNNIWIDPARASEIQAILNPPADQVTETLRLAPLTNRAIAGEYPPGSTLKQFDAAIALQKGLIHPDTKVHDPGRLILEDQYVPGRFYPFVNSNSRAWGDITVSDALKVSSNIFFMSVIGGNRDHVVNLTEEQKNIPEGLAPTEFAEALGWFGLGQPTGIKLAGELSGRVPTPGWKQRWLREAWTTGDTYNASIGQGHLEVTPLQLITAAAAVANNGTVYQPQLVQSIVDANGDVVQSMAPEVVRRVPVDPSYFAIVREGMRRSVTEVANIAARDECSGLQIAGKTGTAEFGPLITIPTANGERHERQAHSWFVGFAPYDNPQIEVLVLSEGTGDFGDGSATIAVPAVTQIMQAYFNVTPPNPLPRGCQTDLPPLPARPEVVAGPTANTGES